ncbi:MAG: hypothetical protein H6607_01615 [Flavobacteriales bacterium]|nr:hypothetical protein [Flavobacteriales bacterium]
MKTEPNIDILTLNEVEISFEIVCFRAIDFPNFCAEYIEGHLNVLRDYGVTSVASSNPTWMFNPNVYCVVALREKEMLAGIRIHKADGKTELPMEAGVSKLDEKVSLEITKNLKVGAGEQCGLWNSKKIKGFGISWVLVNSSIAILSQLKIKRLYGLASDYSMFLFEPAGFRIQRQFGNHGDFEYPTKDYIARVVLIEDCTKLTTSAKEEMNFIKELRKNKNLAKRLKINDLELKLTFRTDLNITDEH